VIPNTGGLKGIEAAAVAGAAAGSAEAGLEVIKDISPENQKLIAELLKNNVCVSYHLKSDRLFHIRVKMFGSGHTSEAETVDSHTNIVKIERDGEILFQKSSANGEGKGPGYDRSLLSIGGIIEFAETVKIDDVKHILDPEIKCNLAIAEEGMRGNYGITLGRTILKEGSPFSRICGYTVSASEARMDGCAMGVITNSGSGNQGIASSVPVIVYCDLMNIPSEKLYRALVLSNLLTIYQKGFIGKLSAFCGAVSSACASAAAITYLAGGTKEQIENTITNTLASASGILCDGAKASCAAKIGTGLNMALLAHKAAMNGESYKPGDGIVCRDADSTIRAVGAVARDGMRDTDEHIIDIMLAN
jgi:L-cysteine desulfidase